MIRRTALAAAVIGATVLATAPTSAAAPTPNKRSFCIAIEPTYGYCTENPVDVVAHIVDNLP